MNAKTAKERQETFRARRAMLEGAQEVRGIFLPQALHAQIKEAAKKLLEGVPANWGE